jgi:predicted MFS family arabinose efflux permease
VGPRQRVVHRDRAVGDRRRRTGGQAGAILLYEAALGVGLSVGPLLGALLGSIWRGPFAGTAVLMAAALVLCSIFLTRDAQERRPKIRLSDPLRALRHGGLLRTSIASALYPPRSSPCWHGRRSCWTGAPSRSG